MKRINHKILSILILILLNVIFTNSSNSRKVEAEAETERVGKNVAKTEEQKTEAKIEKKLEKKLEKIEQKKEEKKDITKKPEKNTEKDNEEDNEKEEMGMGMRMGFNPFGNLGKMFSNFGNFGKNSKNEGGFSSKSESYSYSFANNGKGKKPEKHMRHMSTEEYREQEKGKPARFRKYEEMGKKDNDDPTKIKKKASTNVETEGMLLGNGQDEQTIKDDEFKKMDNFGFDDDFDGFFGRKRKGKKHQGGLFGGFFGGDLFGDDPFFGGSRRTRKDLGEKKAKNLEEQEEDKAIESINGNRFGKYSKFLNEKTKNQLKRR